MFHLLLALTAFARTNVAFTRRGLILCDKRALASTRAYARLAIL